MTLSRWSSMLVLSQVAFAAHHRQIARHPVGCKEVIEVSDRRHVARVVAGQRFAGAEVAGEQAGVGLAVALCGTIPAGP